MEQICSYDSPLGTLTLVSENDALTALWLNRLADDRRTPAENGASQALQDAKQWLDRYFQGEAPSPAALRLAPRGSEFQQTVWQLLLQIPYGQAVSYGTLARQAAAILGKPRMSAQAVGGAVGRNPIAIIIPCHRVLGADRSLTGFTGGMEKKIWLLEHEQIPYK